MTRQLLTVGKSRSETGTPLSSQSGCSSPERGAELEPARREHRARPGGGARARQRRAKGPATVHKQCSCLHFSSHMAFKEPGRVSSRRHCDLLGCGHTKASLRKLCLVFRPRHARGSHKQAKQRLHVNAGRLDCTRRLTPCTNKNVEHLGSVLISVARDREVIASPCGRMAAAMIRWTTGPSCASHLPPEGRNPPRSRWQ